jgi:serine/threonine protein kinase/tetratricopeptide (TPR) repeat protein
VTPQQHERIAALFAQARRLDSPQRSAFLAGACQDDRERAMVQRLLAEDEATHSPLDSNPALRAAAEDAFERAAGPAVASTSSGPDPAPVPAQIGRYRIVQRIGEGGMGTVYLAEQTEPLRRRVALKIIKLGMDTRAVIARFEAERQALALMDHPGVARVIDAGATEQGRPYFVMEYVDGEPLNAYCDRHALSTAQRLELFCDVCHAVQHAHQKGIIHRDLKPSNVLVVAQDGAAVPKVIDFGIAKATAQRLTDLTLHTEQGQMIGTPEYMSPEQAGMNPHDVDTRTDIYALGVMLYELLVGELPFDSASLRQAPLSDIQRIIREQEPPKPSTRLSRMSGAATRAASRRRTDPTALRRQLSGDLDWITMKAIDKDRERRYGSASDLAADIARHLSHQTVLAGAPTRLHRLRKFVRRHRTMFTAVTCIVAALLAGLGATTWQAIVATRARNEASLQAAKATAITAYLEDMLLSADPREGDKDVRVVDVLDDAVAKLDASFGDQPEVAAALCMTLGKTYSGLGKYEAALPVFEKLLALRTELYEPGDPLIGGALSNLAVAHRSIGQTQKAVDLYEQAWEMLRDAPGEEEAAVAVLYNLAIAHHALGNFEPAERFARESVRLHREVFGAQHMKVAMAQIALARALTAQDKLDEAQAVNLELVAIMRAAVGPHHPYLGTALSGLGILQQRMGQSDRAAETFTEALAIMREAHGEDHHYTAMMKANLGTVLGKLGRFDEGADLLGQAVAFHRQAGDTQRFDLAEDLQALAILSRDRGDLDAAAAHAREALDIRTAVLGPDSAETSESRAMLEDIVGDQHK